jgi:hypothetical protein
MLLTGAGAIPFDNRMMAETRLTMPYKMLPIPKNASAKTKVDFFGTD